MVTWEDVSASRACQSWDAALFESQDYNVFQSFAWGEYKSRSGWTPWRMRAYNEDGRVAGMAQILMKSLPGNVKVGWAPGGPLTLFPAAHETGSLLDSLLRQIKGKFPRGCFRFDNYLPVSEERVALFGKFLKPSTIGINSPFSVYLDLNQPIPSLMGGASQHHRRYVAKALRANIDWKIETRGTMAAELSRLYATMRAEKKARIPTTDASQISTLCEAFKDLAVIVTGFIDGEAVSSCLILIAGKKAVYSMGAANREGRRVYASFAMIHRLLEHLRTKGVTEFDFGGVDPASRTANGVNYFKTGFGGELVQRLGEWEWASSPWMRWMFNLSLARRIVAP